MPKPPKKPRDPAKPTRAKAAREPLSPIAPALAELLNPGLNRGTAGVGSQTGLTSAAASRIKPPADNSFDRRADIANAYKARESAAKGLSDVGQRGYTAREPEGEAGAGRRRGTASGGFGPLVQPLRQGDEVSRAGPLDPDLARQWGIEDDASAAAPDEGQRGEAAAPGSSSSCPRWAPRASPSAPRTSRTRPASRWPRARTSRRP